MTSPHPAVLALATLLVALGPAACGGPETRIDTEVQLQIHRESALRWYQMNELDRAEGQATKALELVPDDKQMKLMLGWIRLRRGRPEDVLIAERVFRDLATGDDYRAHLGLAAALERKGVSYRGAGERATRPERARELAEEARIAFEGSVAAYERTLELSRGNARALSGLQGVYSHLHAYDRALAYSERHAEVVERQRQFHRRQLAESPDLSVGAEDRLRKLLEQDEAALVANYLHAAPMLLELDRHADAAARLDDVVAMRPDEATAWALRAQALYALERWGEALECVNAFLELSAELEFDHPDIQQALRIRRRCEAQLAMPAASGAGASASPERES